VYDVAGTIDPAVGQEHQSHPGSPTSGRSLPQDVDRTGLRERVRIQEEQDVDFVAEPFRTQVAPGAETDIARAQDMIYTGVVFRDFRTAKVGMIVNQDDVVPWSLFLFDQVQHSGYFLIVIAVGDNDDTEFRV